MVDAGGNYLSPGLIDIHVHGMAGADTSGTPWYAAGMNWAKANGVSDGTNTTASVTREQLVTMLFRYAAAHGVYVAEPAKTDTESKTGQ